MKTQPLMVEDVELRWAYSHEERVPVIEFDANRPIYLGNKPIFVLEFRLKIDGQWLEWVKVPHDELPPHRHTL